MTVRGIVLDIEGTTTPIAYVHQVLFSYAREHLDGYLTQHAGHPELERALALLRAEQRADGVTGALNVYAMTLIDEDRKSPGLKEVQGLIWEEGYCDGSLRSELFPDVAGALARWRAGGLAIAIFSSGSVLAQRLLFSATDHGDLTPLIDHYFDTGTGPKREAASYVRIARAMQLPSDQLCFISDVVTELDAARLAGMETVLAIRPGNPVQPANTFRAVHSFDELAL